MARPRTATSLLLIRNSFKKHPERLKEREQEPMPTADIGEPPKYLTKAQQNIWNEFVAIIPPGVVRNTDRPWMGMAVRLMHRERKGMLPAQERAQLMSLLSRMGMNPSDRARLKADPSKKKKETDEFSEFTEETTQRLLRDRTAVC
jgi:phage terminase small subunit